MTTSTAPLPLLSPTALASIEALSRAAVQERARGRLDIVEGLHELMRQVVAEDDEICGLCRKPYDAHCSDCYCCPGTHDESCGW